MDFKNFKYIKNGLILLKNLKKIKLIVEFSNNFSTNGLVCILESMLELENFEKLDVKIAKYENNVKNGKALEDVIEKLCKRNTLK